MEDPPGTVSSDDAATQQYLARCALLSLLLVRASLSTRIIHAWTACGALLISAHSCQELEESIKMLEQNLISYTGTVDIKGTLFSQTRARLSAELAAAGISTVQTTPQPPFR